MEEIASAEKIRAVLVLEVNDLVQIEKGETHLPADPIVEYPLKIVVGARLDRGSV